jgi:hypothetical protein
MVGNIDEAELEISTLIKMYNKKSNSVMACVAKCSS